MSRHSPKEVERIKRIASKMIVECPPQGSFAAPAGSADDLPGCIRREILKIRAENRRMEMPDLPDDTTELLAWQRWSKRLSGAELSEAVLIMVMYCVQDRTCLKAKLSEAARRLRQNETGQARRENQKS